MKKAGPRPLKDIGLADLEAAVGGWEQGLRAEGFSLYQMQGELREYCRPQGRGRSCISGVVQNGQWRQGIGSEDFRRNAGEPHLRHLPGASWGDPLPH
jgi:hypothetical protein